MTASRLATAASPASLPLALTPTGAKLLLKAYFAARRAGLAVAGETALYAYLVTRALKRESDWVQVSTEVLARELDVNERTMSRWLSALRDLGWIERRAASRGDGTLEVARTRIPALTRVSTRSHGPGCEVAALEPAGQGGVVTLDEARPILSELAAAPEIRAIGDLATRERICAEVLFAVTRCALSRLPTMALRINVARKKLRQRQWRTPRSMPSDFHGTFAAMRRAALGATSSAEAGPPPHPSAERSPSREIPRSPQTAMAHMTTIAALLDQTTPLSEKQPLLVTYPRASCSTPPMACGEP